MGWSGIIRLRERTFSSLTVRNYRLYFYGQVVSVSGNWMQQIAIAWLVLGLTNSPFQLGLTTALQAAPWLLVGVWGGLVADRQPKRRLLIITQLCQVIPPLLLWLLTERGSIAMWMVYVLVFLRGLVNTIDNPARQSFVLEMVGRDRVVNAVSLNASIVQAGRLFGPAVAALIIATLGLGPCFGINALTFVFMIGILLLIDPEQLRPARVAPRAKRQLRDSLSLVSKTPALRVPLLLMAVVGLLSFNFNVVLPTIARFTYHGTASTYALMMGLLAAGALIGALLAGLRTSVSSRRVAWASVAFGVALGIAALAPNLTLCLLAMILVGATSVTFSASVQASLQLSVEPEMRGRVLSLYQIVYVGTTPLGAVLIGALATATGPRSGLVLGAVAAIAAGALALRAQDQPEPTRECIPEGSTSILPEVI